MSGSRRSDAKPGFHLWHLAFLALILGFAFYLKEYPARFSPTPYKRSQQGVAISRGILELSSLEYGAAFIVG